MFKNILVWILAGISIITVLYFFIHTTISWAKEYWNNIKDENFYYFLKNLIASFGKFFLVIIITLGIGVLGIISTIIYDSYFSLVKLILSPILISIVLLVSYYILDKIDKHLKEDEEKNINELIKHLEEDEKYNFPLYFKETKRLRNKRIREFISILFLSVLFVLIFFEPKYLVLFILISLSMYIGLIFEHFKFGFWVGFLLILILLIIAGNYLNIFSRFNF
jgi:hypothetical protein